MELKRYEYRQTKTPIYRRNHSSKYFLLILLVISTGLYSFLALTKPLEPLNISITSQTFNSGSSQIVWPASGQAAVGTLSNGILAKSSDLQKVSPTASIAKVITALIVLDKKPLDAGESGPQITLNSGDVSIYNSYVAKNGSVAAVQVGEVITQRQLLEGMMLPSANNMADTLAIWAYGSMNEYVKQANIVLAGWGLEDTKVADASGFSPNTVSTPSDLIKIGQRALSNDSLKAIVSEKSAVLPVAGEVRNLNSLLDEKGVVGIKTGNTDEAGGCLLFAATHQFEASPTITVIGVIMGDTNVPQAIKDASTLLSSAKNNIIATTLIKSGTSVGTAKSSWGSSSELVAATDLTVYAFSGKELSSSTSSYDLSSLNQGQEVGTLTVSGGIKDQRISINAKRAVSTPSFWWRLTHYF